MSATSKTMIITNDHSPNGKYYTQHRRYGFKTPEDAIARVHKLALKEYVYSFNKKGKQTYCKSKLNGKWWEKTFDDLGRCINLKTSDGVYFNIKYNSNGEIIEYEDSSGSWWSKEKFPTISISILCPTFNFGDTYSIINWDD